MAADTPSPMPLVLHGLDFIKSSVARLAAEAPSDQQSREAVVLLAIGVELLLKSRLLAEHWSLVFDDVSKANLSMLRLGTLKSAGPKDCLDRLEGICDVPVTRRARKSLTDFWEFRNRVVHFASPMPSASLRARAFDVLGELVELAVRPGFMPTEAVAELDGLREALLQMEQYVVARCAAIADRLTEARDASFFCPTCGQCAFMMRENERNCSFCLFEYDHYSDIVEAHLEREHGSPAHGREVATCLACDSWYSVVLERQNSTTMRCLQCWRATNQATLCQCSSCNHWYTSTKTGEPGECSDCGRSLPRR